MNIVFTCGGTGGHIYPAIAVARMFRERQPDCRILFIGAEDGMENKLVPREGFELQTVQISNYQRKLTPAAIWHNLVTVQRMSATFAKTKRILKDFQPDVIVGTGGYASFPALKMGAKLGIPTCVHESNAVPGLTTKLVARTASRIMVSFDASRQHYPDPEKVLLTGTPSRARYSFKSLIFRMPKWNSVAARAASACPTVSASRKCSILPAPPLAITGTPTSSAIARVTSSAKPLPTPSQSMLVSRISPAPRFTPSAAHSSASSPVFSRPPRTYTSQPPPARDFTSIASTMH